MGKIIELKKRGHETFVPSLMGNNAVECLHLVLDESGEFCAVCGTAVEAPYLGDIMGIIRLIDSTVRMFTRMIAANTDPGDPTQPRLRIVGGVMLRVPHKALYKRFFTPSYREAKELGYRGTLERWSEILEEAAGPQDPVNERFM
jgi:hypothetical protein